MTINLSTVPKVTRTSERILAIHAQIFFSKEKNSNIVPNAHEINSIRYFGYSGA
jgi:hypothetical protein